MRYPRRHLKSSLQAGTTTICLQELRSNCAMILQIAGIFHMKCYFSFKWQSESGDSAGTLLNKCSRNTTTAKTFLYA